MYTDSSLEVTVYEGPESRQVVQYWLYPELCNGRDQREVTFPVLYLASIACSFPDQFFHRLRLEQVNYVLGTKPLTVGKPSHMLSPLLHIRALGVMGIIIFILLIRKQGLTEINNIPRLPKSKLGELAIQFMAFSSPESYIALILPYPGPMLRIGALPLLLSMADIVNKTVYFGVDMVLGWESLVSCGAAAVIS